MGKTKYRRPKALIAAIITLIFIFLFAPSITFIHSLNLPFYGELTGCYLISIPIALISFLLVMIVVVGS